MRVERAGRERPVTLLIRVPIPGRRRRHHHGITSGGRIIHRAEGRGLGIIQWACVGYARREDPKGHSKVVEWNGGSLAAPSWLSGERDVSAEKLSAKPPLYSDKTPASVENGMVPVPLTKRGGGIWGTSGFFVSGSGDADRLGDPRRLWADSPGLQVK